MICFEISLNGQRVCTAGAGDQGVLTAIVSSVAKQQELGLEIGGLTEGAHLKWPAPRGLALGDEVAIRIVETDHPDPPATTTRDAAELVEEAERMYYERLKQKYEGT